jgi:hypothetical protein
MILDLLENDWRRESTSVCLGGPALSSPLQPQVAGIASVRGRPVAPIAFNALPRAAHRCGASVHCISCQHVSARFVIRRPVESGPERPADCLDPDHPPATTFLREDQHECDLNQDRQKEASSRAEEPANCGGQGIARKAWMSLLPLLPLPVADAVEQRSNLAPRTSTA